MKKAKYGFKEDFTKGTTFGLELKEWAFKVESRGNRCAQA